MILWLSGPTGSGKTTLAHALARGGYLVINERFPLHLLGEFRSNPSTVCFEIQQYIMASRLSQWRDRDQSIGKFVFDRSVNEDFEIFCTLHHRTGLLNDDQFEDLRRQWTVAKEALPVPDLVIGLLPNLSTLESRVTLATHPPAIVDNLAAQAHLYEDWVGHQKVALRVDNSDVPLEVFQALFER